MKKTILTALCALVLVPLLRAGDTQTAVLGAGCFWCVEAIYEQQPGVEKVVSGYAGGDKANPTYEEVSAGTTGHVEAVQIYFDPDQTSYRKLIDYFWKTHDPTNPDGVEPDFGSSYRSAIFPENDEQMKEAKASEAAAQKDYDKPIATIIKPLKKFYPAEGYHQDYAKKNPDNSYIRGVTGPRLARLGLKLP